MEELTVFALCSLCALLGAHFWEPAVNFFVDMMPTPWQCSLPGPPASCYGNLQLGVGLSLLLILVYAVFLIAAPTVYATYLMFLHVMKRRNRKRA